MNGALDGLPQEDRAVPPRIGATTVSRPAGWLPWAIAIGLAASVSVLFFFDPVRWPFYPRCFLHEATGLLCPGCGSLRALHQLLHGHLAAAVHFNPLLVVSLPLLAWQALRLALRYPAGRAAPLSIRPAWLCAALAVLVVFTVLRNVPLPQLAWLGLHP